MSQDTQYNDVRSEVVVVQLLERLSEVYRGYLEKDQNQGKSKRRITQLFRGWFVRYDPLVADAMHQEFLDEVEHVTVQLAMVLKQLIQDDPGLCEAYAAKAINLMLAPKPAREKTTAEWYITIAEYQSEIILPYLSWDELKRIRDTWVKRIPKRMMYPKQGELFEEMEKLLAVKQTS